MEKELLKKFRDAEKHTASLGKETAEQEYLDEANVKEIVREVLNELHFKTNGNTKNQ
jgi:uncharacterized protein YpuA (DUF1002 family)